MKYRDYKAADFANDPFFIQWIKRPDEESKWFWSSFIADNPQCAEEVRKAIMIVKALQFPEDGLQEDELALMHKRLLLGLRAEKEEVGGQLTRQVSRKTSLWLKIAASLLIIPFVFFGGYVFVNESSDATAWLTKEKSNVEERVNPSGQKSVLFLSDGTKVWLNAASKLSYQKDFGSGDSRDVHLEGEAFFDVAHNEEKPFIVHTSSIKIKVLGTSFNVKSYTEEKTIETTLIKGKVKIEKLATSTQAQEEVVLKPNQRAVFNKESKVIEVRKVQSENSGSWKDERLVFNAEPVDNVILQLERWYDVKIHVEGRGRLDCRLSARIENESLEEVLKLLETSHGITYRINGRVVFLEGSLCGGKP